MCVVENEKLNFQSVTKGKWFKNKLQLNAPN